MSCEECRVAIYTHGAWNRFDGSRCRYCAARRIQFIQRLKKRPRDEISARCTAALQDALKAGHDEKEIRAMVRGDMAIEPAARVDARKHQ